jgi:hypothetical protein
VSEYDASADDSGTIQEKVDGAERRLQHVVSFLGCERETQHRGRQTGLIDEFPLSEER